MKLLLIAVALGFAAGCVTQPPGCCDAYSATDEKGLYCLAHRDVVLRFVREPADAAQRRLRLDWFKTFLKTLEPLEDSDEVDAKIQAIQKARPEFWKQYSPQHFWAGRDTNLGPERRGQLMKCGFKHAVTQLEAELDPARANP